MAVYVQDESFFFYFYLQLMLIQERLFDNFLLVKFYVAALLIQ